MKTEVKKARAYIRKSVKTSLTHFELLSSWKALCEVLDIEDKDKQYGFDYINKYKPFNGKYL